MQEEKGGLCLGVPEDLGGHQIRGPASIWQLREFQVLESVHDVRRGAGFLCQLANAEAKRPLGILTTLAKLQTRALAAVRNPRRNSSLRWPTSS